MTTGATWRPTDGGITMPLWGTADDPRNAYTAAVTAGVTSGAPRCASTVLRRRTTPVQCELPAGHGGHHSLLIEWRG